MRWKICLACIAIIMMSACSLNQAASENVTELTPASLEATATPVVTKTFTPTPLPSATAKLSQAIIIPTSTPIPIQVASNNSSTTSCTVTRVDLPVYIVVAGDTLSNIARKTNSTVNELAQINCLSDVSQIRVGQQLHVLQAPTSNSTTTITNNNSGGGSNTTTSNNTTPNTTNGVRLIDTKPSGDNAINVSPYESNQMLNGIGHYIVRSDATVTLTWHTMPTDLGIIQVDFFYVDDHYTVLPTAIGLDTNVTDGASITWTIPDGAIGRIYASARLPGQYHEGVISTDIRIEALPYTIGPRGALSIDPSEQANGDYIIEPNTTVTITWSGIDPPEYENVRQVEFHFLPDTGGIQILGKDTDKSDGISVIWIIPDNVSGRIRTSGGYGNNNESNIFSPDIHVRTPDQNIARCEFDPFGIGGDVPVYGIPNLNTEPIHTIRAGTSYPVLGSGYQTDNFDNGLFYHLDFGNFSGWVQDYRGALIGDCDL